MEIARDFPAEPRSNSGTSNSHRESAESVESGLNRQSDEEFSSKIYKSPSNLNRRSDEEFSGKVFKSPSNLISNRRSDEEFSAKPRNSSRSPVVSRLKSLINRLPRENCETLKLLLLHLNRVSRLKEENQMNAANLGICFGPNLLWRK